MSYEIILGEPSKKEKAIIWSVAKSETEPARIELIKDVFPWIADFYKTKGE